MRKRALSDAQQREKRRELERGPPPPAGPPPPSGAPPGSSPPSSPPNGSSSNGSRKLTPGGSFKSFRDGSNGSPNGSPSEGRALGRKGSRAASDGPGRKNSARMKANFRKSVFSGLVVKKGLLQKKSTGAFKVHHHTRCVCACTMHLCTHALMHAYTNTHLYLYIRTLIIVPSSHIHLFKRWQPHSLLCHHVIYTCSSDGNPATSK
jgi:hypothetical protein